jgi:hypothetical protein
MNEDYLAHHGVLGMKWGVRKASRAYANAETASDKANAKKKMVSELSKDSKKLNKLNAKASKMIGKTVNKKYGVFGSQSKYEKYKARADKKAYKAKKWYDNMETQYKQQNIVDISDSDKKLGEKYINYFRQASEISKSF